MVYNDVMSIYESNRKKQKMRDLDSKRSRVEENKINILTEIESKKNISETEFDDYLDQITDLKEKFIIKDTTYERYKKTLINKLDKEEFDNKNNTSNSYIAGMESDIGASDLMKQNKENTLRLKEHDKIEQLNRKYEEDKYARYNRYESDTQGNSFLQKSGIIRLGLFVFFAILLLFFVTKSGINGFSNSSILIFLVLFVIFFALGKGGEKNIFGRGF